MQTFKDRTTSDYKPFNGIKVDAIKIPDISQVITKRDARAMIKKEFKELLKRAPGARNGPWSVNEGQGISKDFGQDFTIEEMKIVMEEAVEFFNVGDKKKALTKLANERTFNNLLSKADGGKLICWCGDETCHIGPYVYVSFS